MIEHEVQTRRAGRRCTAQRGDLVVDVDVARRRLTLFGELDNTGVPLLYEVFDVVCCRRARRFTIDLHGLDFLAAGGVTALVRLQDRARDSGGAVCVVGAEGIVRRVLVLCGVEERLCGAGWAPAPH